MCASNLNKPADFKDRDELERQVFNILDFYYPYCIDKENGGYYEGMLDDGTIYDYETKNLVGTARFVYVFSVGFLLSGDERWREAAEHGIKFIQESFLDKENNGYFSS